MGLLLSSFFFPFLLFFSFHSEHRYPFMRARLQVLGLHMVVILFKKESVKAEGFYEGADLIKCPG